MPDLIIIRLHPTEPMSASDFTTLLNGLTITAFDLSFAKSVEGDQIGVAQGLADPHTGAPGDNSVDVNNTAILQHYFDIVDPITNLPIARNLEAAATAVIIVNLPAGHHEYPSANSFDIRLKLTRGGTDILDRVFDYNVQVTSVGALSNNQTVYFGMDASAYVALPPAGAGLTLPADGQPLNFDDLVSAINLVLAQDPSGGNLQTLSPLTAAQSRHVAAEIIWNRTLFPPPALPRSLGDMYTRPPVNPAIHGDEVDKAEQDRKKFEGELLAYHATHDAEATRLAGFVFAASAAVICENLSTTATRAGLTFPIITGGISTTIPQASVILADPVATNPLNPAFTVPAAYFYALGAQLPFQVSAQQRYEMARLESEQRLLNEFQAAIDARVIVLPVPPAPAPPVQPAQAARRLRALGTTTRSLPVVDLAPPVTVLVEHWLDYAGSSANINNDFWEPEVAEQPAEYLRLVLHAVTRGHQPLITDIPNTVNSVAKLVQVQDQQWRAFFLDTPLPPSPPAPPPQVAFPAPADIPAPRIELLPPFTQPGTAPERVEAFIRHLRKFFAVPFGLSAPQPLSAGAPPTLGRSLSDPLVAFINAGSPCKPMRLY